MADDTKSEMCDVPTVTVDPPEDEEGNDSQPMSSASSIAGDAEISRVFGQATLKDRLLAGEPPHTPMPREAFLDCLPHVFTQEDSPNPWPSQPADQCGKNVAIFTSGGDAPGMNAAVRGAAAVCLTYGVKVYGIQYGYQGMVDGGDKIFELTWSHLQEMISKGGTVIGSARCQAFRQREGRLSAAENLVKNGINCLLAIGGDGTLTGANLFKQEWPSLLDELASKNRITQQEAEEHRFLSVVGMVGSIDNDMCGFSMTIGCDTALHRIVSAVDALTTTAQSHQRTFIIEVMGRNCGFLAVMAALACGADYVLVPEHPPDFEDWESAMCDSLQRRRQYTNYSLIIVAEGATDRVRRPITSAYLKKVLSERLGHDTRVTCLGHVQRGGAPSAYDRILATRCGAEAALAVLNATPETPARIIGVRWNKMIQIDLTEAVERTREVGTCLDERDWERVLQLRGPAFRQELNIFLRIRQRHIDVNRGPQHRIAVLHVGSPACGMNSAAKAVVRDFINGGHLVYGVNEGFEGLAAGDLKEMQWQSVKGWSSHGGANLGTNRTLPSGIPNGLQSIAATVKKHGIHGIVVIGGFESFVGLLEITAARDKFPELHIPIAMIPATISNNVPGSAFSLGCDTALNAIVDSIDRIRQSATSSRRRVFVVETMGNYCGYLATLGALAGGADAAYVPEEGVRLRDIQSDVENVRTKFKTLPSAVFVRNEQCSESYTTPVITSIFEEEGKPDPLEPEHCTFTARSVILGHLQQGGAPSPLDRVRGSRLAFACNHFLLHHMNANYNKDTDTVATPDASSICVIGIEGNKEVATPVDVLRCHADFDRRTPKEHWWKGVHRLIRLLEGSMRSWDELYQGEAEVSTVARQIASE